MIFPCFRTVPVPAIGSAMLTQPGLLTAGEAAIALSAITLGVTLRIFLPLKRSLFSN